MKTQYNNKNIASSLNTYTDGINKGTNLLLDGVAQINKWYAEQLNKISEGMIPDSRLETNIDNTIPTEEIENNNIISKIETKVDEYNEIQTDSFKNKKNIKHNDNNSNRLKTQAILNDEESIDVNSVDETFVDEEIITKDEYSVKVLPSLNTRVNKSPKEISVAIKEIKKFNNATSSIVKKGKTLNTAINEGGLKSFENSSNRIMTKPARKIANKYTSKATNIVRKNGVKATKKVFKETTNIVVKSTKVAMKLVVNTIKVLTSMTPSIAPIIIIIIIVAAFGEFFNIKDTNELDDVKFEEISSMIIEIEDEKIQAIYNEYLKNMGKPYLMDHSNLNYDECMDYYDCSSWVIHCLAHTGIITIPNTGALGLYDVYCVPVEESNRQAGDLIFLKDTYDTGNPGSISHVGIYMGELTINGETAEWIIDTGGNPKGVKISKYKNGWWDGSHFFGFGRLKE